MRRGPPSGHSGGKPFTSDLKSRCGPPHCGQSFVLSQPSHATVLPEADRTIRTLVITGLADDELVFSALRAGASGFLLKTTASAELPAAINRILAGDNYLDASVTRSVVADIVARPVPARPEPGILDRLTPREREILKLMAYGLTNADIAERLTVATATVKTHVSRVLMKLDVDDRTQAVVAAYQNRLVSAGEDGI